MVQDLTFGTDIRGGVALFIDVKHIVSDWELDKEAQEVTQELSFFRIIVGGEQQRQHGWVSDGKVVQWG